MNPHAMTSTYRRASRRGLALFSVALTAAVAVAARPASPGVTYRLRMVMTPPDMPGMQMAPIVLVGRGSTIGAQSRLDIDSVSGDAPMAIGDYMLTLDSGRIITVNPTSKTYSDAASAMVAIPAQMLAQASITNVNVTTEKLGAGEAIQGYATEKVRMTTTYVLNIMGQSMNAMNVSEMSMAKLPAAVTTPFDGNMPRELLEGPMKELGEKMLAARKELGTATALKTVNTSTMTAPMFPQAITTVMTVELLDLKTADVDPAVLRIPEGYSKKP
jgi:hypothetical protein